MALFRGFSFGGVNSLTYGIYITGQAVYNAPERAVEMVSIPGRNGALAIDQGRFENIEVTYNCGCFANTQSAFAAKVRDFRNALASMRGYQRITDDYNSDEYRLAIFRADISIDPVANSSAGEFEIVFDAKPQRFLAAGETSVSVSSGDTLANPTLFSSKPLLKVTGYGELTIGDVTVEVAQPETAGDIYIDCDIMESYQLLTSTPSAVNSLITLSGNEYPVLEPGNNTITYTGITALSITPRWWRL